MMIGLRQPLIFVYASVTTSLVWFYFWPRVSPETAVVLGNPGTLATQSSWNPDSVSAKLAAIKNASTASERLDACLELSKIPVAEVPALLEQMKPEIEGDFSPELQILLIRWASSDGKAAANWAWKSFRAGSQWENAFKQIGATWAAHNPVALGKWTIETAKNKTGEWHDSVTLEQAEASDTPLLDSTFLRKIPEWLVTEDPYMAYKVILETRLNRYEEGFARALASVSKVREALLACEESTDPEVTQSSSFRKMKNSLLLRWFEIDPEDFKRHVDSEELVISPEQATASVIDRWGPWSEAERVEKVNIVLSEVNPAAQKRCIIAIASAWAQSDPGAAVRWLDSLPPENEVSINAARIHALAPHHLTATLDWADRLPSEQRQNLLVSVFDAWTQANPGQQADRAGWPDERAQAWEDLETLQSATRNK